MPVGPFCGISKNASPEPGEAFFCLPGRDSEPIAQRHGVGRVVAGAGFRQLRQSVLNFGADDEMPDDEIRAETGPDLPAANVETGVVGHGRMEQAGDVGTSVQGQPRALREAERDEGFDRKVETGEPRGLVRVVVEDVVRGRGALHREEEPRAEPPAFREEVLDAGSGVDAHLEVLVADGGGRRSCAEVCVELSRGAEGCEKQAGGDE